MKFLFHFVVCLFLTASARGQIANPAETQKRIENYLAALGNAGYYGTVLVEINGKDKISKGYGFSNKEKKLLNSPATIFDIGSLTKQFTAAAILKMEQDGKIAVSDKISKYFESIPSDKQSITIHDLLRHQSGLESNVGKDYEKISERDFLEKVFNSKLRFEPGNGFNYSNIGYSLLAMIIERVSQMNYETYLAENLFKPSQMNSTGYTKPAFDTTYIATGYNREEKPWGKPTDKEWDTDAPYWHLKGNGGILSTTEDLYNWHKALMTENILSKEQKEKMVRPKLRSSENGDSWYAYGWDVSKTKRNTLQVWHNGSNRIFYADFLRYIDENIVLIMLTNKSHPNFNNLLFEIVRIIFNPAYSPAIPHTDNEVNRNFTQRIINTIEESGVEEAKKVYMNRNASENILEYLLGDAGFDQLDNSKPQIAIGIFEFNVFANPGSARALQYLAEGYLETGKKDLALEYFKKSLSINPESLFVNDMVKKLQE